MRCKGPCLFTVDGYILDFGNAVCRFDVAV
jgi:hypothetical protein